VKWFLRIPIALLLLLALLTAAAWLTFPWYAQSIIDRALAGKPFHIEISGPGLPGPSGIGFRSLKATFITPPDECSNDAVSYTLSLSGGSLSWKLENRLDSVNRAAPWWPLPLSIDAAVTLKADSLSIVPKPKQFTFNDRNSVITCVMKVSRNEGFSLSIKPLSAAYTIRDAAVSREKLRLEGVDYNVRLSAAEHWQQALDTLHVAKLFSDGKPSPVGNFRALFGSKRDPQKPCLLTLSQCTVDLFEWKASTDRIEYDLKEKKSRFTLSLAEIPLTDLPGFKRSGSSSPSADGRVSGFIPIEFQDSTVTVRNAVIAAGKGSRIIFYTSASKPWLSLDLGPVKGGSELLKQLNATITLNSKGEKLSGLALSGLSGTLFGGTITATPFLFEPTANRTRLTLKLKNIGVLDRVRLHGDFKGSLKGSVSGSVPISIEKNRFAISNARLKSTGGGTVTIAPPRKQETTANRILGSTNPDASYTFSEPDLVLSRSVNGRLTLHFRLKNLLRKTTGGELLLLAPGGNLTLWQNRLNPNIVTLTDFSAGLLDGTVSIAHVDYDMGKKSAETTLLLNNIPLQKLLDLQGTKKIYATGTVRGSIPVAMKNERFEIKKGGMIAEQSGQIIYATTPEERAAANQGLRTTYEALSNFLYVQLLSSINMTPDGKSVITIQLKGTNPDFQGGRGVELNLNVEQNLLDLLRALSVSSNVEEIISEKALRTRKK
jgi:hypothetical protein